MNKIPTKIKKKYRIIENFKNFLLKNEPKSSTLAGTIDPGHIVKGWMKSKNAILFKLSRKTIQIVFNDNSEIRMISKPTKRIEYVWIIIDLGGLRVVMRKI